MQRLWTKEEIAEHFGVTERTVRNWCAAGRFKHAWKPTERSAWLVPEKEVLAFIPPKRGRPKEE